tara:strand:+ start:172 stop:564 length:393 start_codon:yes stop_codon:yes gene_type:complete
MRTNSLKKLVDHNFFIYGMVFISVLQLVNFYNSKSLICLGVFGLTYYIVNLSTKNQGVCLLAANIVSIFLLGCEKSAVFEGFQEGHPDVKKEEEEKREPEEVEVVEVVEEPGDETTGASPPPAQPSMLEE